MPQATPPQPLNLARACLQGWAADSAHASRPAFTFVTPEGNRTWTFAEVWDWTERVARSLLDRGLVPGERVLLLLPHSPEYAIAFLGATLAGCVPIPASPLLTAEEKAFLIEDAEPAAVVTTPDLAPEGYGGIRVLADELATASGAAPLPETSSEDPAYLIYTSGSTAHPKGVLHGHRTILARRLMRDAWQGFGPSDRTLHAGMLNWSYTLGVGLLDAWAAGAHAHLVDHPFDAADWPRELQRLRTTVFVAVPTVYRQILQRTRIEDYDLSTLRHGLCSGEPMPPALLDEWRQRTGTELYEALGMTEISTYISSAPTVPTRPGSAGKPQPGRRVAILEESGDEAGRTTGRELPRGQVGLLSVYRNDPGLMLGYWRRPAEQAQVTQGEWFVGGDLASMDEDGYVYFAGRADDVIKSFGHRLSPVEIETELARHPAVQEVAAVGLPVEAMKTLVAVAVRPREGASLTEAELRAFAAEHLAGYKQPHLYRFVEALPRTRNGKLNRRALIEELIRGMPAPEA